MKADLLEKQIDAILYTVGRPGRYVGGEYGVIRKGSQKLKMALSYPDLYEIGMCNLAVRLLYNRINRLQGVSCERVFAPDRDFESELRKRKLPLCSLESSLPLHDFDILGFSVGYELTATNLLNILDLGGIGLERRERDEKQPLVIASGPAITNPVPLGRYLDAVLIGEGEDWVQELLPELLKVKEAGGKRSDMLAVLLEHPAVWSQDKPANRQSPVTRSLWKSFGETAEGAFTPVPNIRIIQDHGVVEIMRGCPKGCRFCHAGVFYRPVREKRASQIWQEVESLVFECGYRNINLSSLSSGDYADIEPLCRFLNERFKSLNVSFSVPSMRIDSMALNLLSEISTVRKSGLTLAVETPVQEWQQSINKSVSQDHAIDILKEAKKLGWNKAKFYFMLGLPEAAGSDEAGAIIDFLRQVHKETGIQLRVNLATFIPKPHTPYQWDRQIGEEEAMAKIAVIRKALSGRHFKIGYHAPFASVVEGIMSRGDERVGELILAAFRKGARLDAWEEHFDWDIWRNAIAHAGWPVVETALAARETESPLPWDGIDLGVSRKALLSERKKSRDRVFTEPCSEHCTHLCGVCGKSVGVRRHELDLPSTASPLPVPDRGTTHRAILAFSKTGRAVFYSHLDVMTIFERSLLRAGIFPAFTRGYNPKPRMEFASPLALGISSEQEIVSLDFFSATGDEDLQRRLNHALPDGIEVCRSGLARPAGSVEKPVKRKSLMSLYWGSTYQISAEGGSKAWATLSSALLSAKLRSRMRDIQEVEEAGEGLLVCQQVIQGEPSSILKRLSGLIEGPPFERGIRIRRMATWARDDSGEKASYFDLLT